jgi:hypothetical protein
MTGSPLLRSAALVALLTSQVPSLASAQVVTRAPREGRDRQEWSGEPRTWAGGTLTYASPTGEFKSYVNGAFGANGHLVHQFGGGILAFRADLSYLIYGSTTRRQQLGGGALSLIAVDVTTSNNIVNGGVGLQLMAPSGSLRPYLNGNVGFSYFFTESSVDGSNENGTSPFASTKNFDDAGFSPSVGGGIYIPLKMGIKNPILLDLGVQAQSNRDMRYLTKESIYIRDTQSQPVITPVRSAANFVSFRVGVSVGVR